jgi:hypothetical protein
MTIAILGVGFIFGFLIKSALSQYQKTFLYNKAYNKGHTRGYRQGLEQNGIVVSRFEQVGNSLTAYVVCESKIPQKEYS